MDAVRGLVFMSDSYFAAGGGLVLFMISLMFMYKRRPAEHVRLVFFTGSLLLLAVIFCPVLFHIFENYVDRGTYWRLLWLLPVSPVMAYGAAELLDGDKKALTAVMLVLVLLAGGRFMYTGVTNGERRLAENPYQLPQELVDMADAMEGARKTDETLKAAFPPELLVYIRQYDADIILPYGREVLDPGWGGSSGFYQQMSSLTLDFDILADKCLYNDVRFIVVNSTKAQLNAPEDNGFELFGTYGGYLVYEYIYVRDQSLMSGTVRGER
ncbi:MAG: hypothetical protein IKI75_10780 [Lachnospiraceae bacterium]|nr:hypothetical protein [Lachnospiraceae bacterium]